MAPSKPWAFFTKRVIHNSKGEPYLERWIIFRCNWFAIYLHKILQSDEDRHLHCHPWNFMSIILLGFYTETVFSRGGGLIAGGYSHRDFSAPTINYKKAEQPHRLTLTAGPVWTLVFCGRRRRIWGFHTDRGFVPYDTYLTEKFGGEHWRAAE